VLFRSLPDGRMHVVVEGGRRFRLLEVGHDRSFDTGTIEDLVDDDEPAEADDVQRVADTFGRVQRTVGAPGEPPSPSSPLFDFEIVARVEFSNDRKQELLELTSPRERMARLAGFLEHALEALELDHELRRRAHGNGRVAPLDA